VLRRNLATGGPATHLYAHWLDAFLKVDGFFGDAGMVDQTLFPHAFGLRAPAPLWTAPSFERCLVLALLYPIATIIIVWAVSGDVGPAEEALGLPPDIPGWTRELLIVAFGSGMLACGWSIGTSGWISVFWSISAVIFAGAGAVGVAFAFGNVGAGIFAGVAAVRSCICDYMRDYYLRIPQG